jgi:enoyl-CoA hydratase/carnithine racemase
MPEPRLLVDRDGPILTVRFNRAPRHFFDEQMSIELDLLTRQAAGDRTIRVVILTGQGDSYLTHYDVPELLGAAQRSPVRVPYRLARALAVGSSLAARSRRVDRLLSRTIARDLITSARVSGAFRRMAQDDTVYLTAINGLALGMGCILALNCDLRLMADGPVIGLPEASLGIVAALGGTQKLVRNVGPSRALQLMLEGELMTADEAADLGLVHRVLAADELQAAARETAIRV